MSKYAKLELPDDLGNDWHYCRAIELFRVKRMTDPVQVKVADKYVDAEEGDYVLLDRDGEMLVMSEPDFGRQFTIVPPSKRDTHFNQTP